MTKEKGGGGEDGLKYERFTSQLFNHWKNNAEFCKELNNDSKYMHWIHGVWLALQMAMSAI